MPKRDCICCGHPFESKRDELHEMGFPHPPDGAASIRVHVTVPNKPPEAFTKGSYSFWHTICMPCGERFAEAARDPVVVQELVDLLGWYVRQGIDLKKMVDKIKGDLAQKG